jgi:hypothetical protein
MHNKFRNNPHPLLQEKTGEVEICRDNFNFMARSLFIPASPILHITQPNLVSPLKPAKIKIFSFKPLHFF